MALKIVMNGALGRMGRRILSLAAGNPTLDISGAIEADGLMTGMDIGDILGVGSLGVPVSNDLATVLDSADVVIDFTCPEVTLRTAQLCNSAGIPLVSGTTGLTQEQREDFIKYSSSIPCVLAPNMSIGVNLLFKLVSEAASFLGDEYDVEITEAHHRFKKDAPSGTAARLAEIVAETLNRDLAEEARYGRQGIVGERTQKEIGIHALRIGDVVGEHTVSFGTIGERFELTHKAQSRDALASGALRAAQFVVNATPGLYDMQDVLGLR